MRSLKDQKKKREMLASLLKRERKIVSRVKKPLKIVYEMGRKKKT